MARRAIQEDVRKIFSKYVKNFVQRLKRDDAVLMLQQEFGMTEEEAQVMFDVYDKDSNNELSLWEFQQFYNTVGDKAHEIINTFHQLEKDGTGQIDIEQAWDRLREMKTDEDKKLSEQDIEMLLKTTAGPEKSITLPKFINLMCRFKTFKVKDN